MSRPVSEEVSVALVEEEVRKTTGELTMMGNVVQVVPIHVQQVVNRGLWVMESGSSEVILNSVEQREQVQGATTIERSNTIMPVHKTRNPEISPLITIHQSQSK